MGKDSTKVVIVMSVDNSTNSSSFLVIDKKDDIL